MDSPEDDLEDSPPICEDPDVPDGGWGWIVALGSMTINIIYDGVSYSFGILFVKLLDYFGDTKSNTAFIGALFFSVPLILGPVASILADKYGYRKATMACGVIAAAGFALASFANSTWMLCVCYGLVSGFGMSVPYFASSVAVAMYFKKRLALAAGIAECGAGLGTVIFAPFTSYLISTYDWRGALLIISGVVLNIVVCGALIRPVKQKHPSTSRADSSSVQNTEERSVLLPSNTLEPESNHSSSFHQKGSLDTDRKHHQSDACLYRSSIKRNTNSRNVSESFENEIHLTGLSNKHLSSSIHSIEKLQRKDHRKSLPIIKFHLENKESKEQFSDTSFRQRLKYFIRDFRDLFQLHFGLFTMCNFVMYFWYDVPYVFVVDRAISLGISTKGATFLVSLIGIVHTVSNIVYGYIADKDCVNTSLLYGVSIILCGVSMFVVPMCYSLVTMSVACACFGLFSAATEVLCAPIIVDIVGVKKLNKGFGIMMLLEGIANLAGPPIAGLLCDITGTYDATFYVAGLLVILAGCAYTVLPLWTIICVSKRQEHALDNVIHDCVI